MTAYSLDASAVVKRYADEPGSTWVRHITDAQAHHTILLAEITLAEVAAALAARIREATDKKRAWRRFRVSRASSRWRSCSAAVAAESAAGRWVTGAQAASHAASINPAEIRAPLPAIGRPWGRSQPL